jgi:hypothetical protein
VQLQCLLFLFLLHASYTGLIRSISPASVSTNLSRPPSRTFANIYARLCSMTEAAAAMFLYQVIAGVHSSAPPGHCSPSIAFITQGTSPIRTSSCSSFLNLHASVPSKPCISPHVTYCLDTEQYHIWTPIIVLFLLTSSC